MTLRTVKTNTNRRYAFIDVIKNNDLLQCTLCLAGFEDTNIVTIQITFFVLLWFVNIVYVMTVLYEETILYVMHISVPFSCAGSLVACVDSDVLSPLSDGPSESLSPSAKP